ncbi:MAG: hypothetical protein OEY34_05820 [Cyclobacteriaceae bacterium]|nr:hypothetical protein [Cyclobacteriaceae bacterium]
MKGFFLTLIFIPLFWYGCESKINAPEVGNADLRVNYSQKLYDDIAAGKVSDTLSTDLFTIKEVSIMDTTLLIKVSYSGGCNDHTFDLVWPEIITQQYPPDITVYLYHDSNGDSCEALLTKTLAYDFSDCPLGLSKEAIQLMRITVVNGSNPENTVSNK